MRKRGCEKNGTFSLYPELFANISYQKCFLENSSGFSEDCIVGQTLAPAKDSCDLNIGDKWSYSLQELEHIVLFALTELAQHMWSTLCV